MKDLVLIKDNNLITTSLIISKEFGKEHKHILRDIRNITNSIKDLDNAPKYGRVDYVDSKGEKRPMYEMNRDAWMLLVMGYTTANAMKIKLAFIKAFNKMELYLKNLLQKEYKEWERVRIICKQNRREFTKEIDIFIDYAKEQGSTGANWYYSNFTKLVNSNLFGCSSAGRVNKNLRDYLNEIQLTMVTAMEYMLSKLLVDEIDNGTYYKDIYQIAKVQACKFALLVGKEAPSYLNDREVKQITYKKEQQQLSIV